ncbi:MAG TPA: hypothetical protein VFO93_00065 [Hymenobacter sp.]|nr:hypothetical protein [Hymenobacter sp.]HET9501902.1 hypothetical protein [Hymenobacter sp.]
MDEKTAFLRQHTRGHLGLYTSLGQVLAEAAAKAAIHKDELHLVKQFITQGQGIPDLGGSGSVVTVGCYYAASQQID